MKSKESDYYFVQPYTNDYEAEIPDRRQRDEREIDQIVSDVFRHLYAVYDEPTFTEDNRTTLSRWFYNHTYIEPNISYGDEGGANISVDEFLDDVCNHKHDLDRNMLTYLVGRVGIGKTAFVNWLISCKLKPYVDGGSIWFVRMDVEEIRRGEPITSSEFNGFLAKSILRIIEKRGDQFAQCEEEVESFIDLFKNPVNVISDMLIIEAIRNLVHAIQINEGRRLLLVIDNLDYLCHLNDRGLFFDLEDTGDLHILQQVAACIAMFAHHGELGSIGANTLVVTRPDSYRILKDVISASYMKSPLVDRNTRYSLVDPGWKAVLAARCELLREAIKYYDLPDRKKKKLEELPDAIENDLAMGRPKLIEHLNGLSNQGLRQLIDFFSNYGWISRDDWEAEPRVLEHPPVGLLTFMLSNRCRYGQIPCEFPNIYLINRPLDQISNTDAEHRHTYWLKRLILAVIESRKFQNIADIIHLFSDGGASSYEESIVKLSLGSLTDALCSNCVSVERGLHPDRNREKLVILDIFLNARGKHCLGHIFDRFSYLQLAVEDYMLPLPRCVEKDFPADRFGELNYGYLVDPSAGYRSSTSEMVGLKARQVLIFLKILERSLRWEQMYFEDVFARLQTREVSMPSVSKIRNNVLEELGLLNKYLAHRIDLVEIVDYCEAKDEEIDAQLGAAYAAGASM